MASTPELPAAAPVTRSASGEKHMHRRPSARRPGHHPEVVEDLPVRLPWRRLAVVDSLFRAEAADDRRRLPELAARHRREEVVLHLAVQATQEVVGAAAG